MSTLRAGLVGLGVMGRKHLDVLRALPGVTLAGVCDPFADAALLRDGEALVADVDALVALGLDVAVVAVPNDAHAIVAQRLAAAGVPTLVEKPVAPDLVQARSVLRAFAAAGTPGYVGHVERFNPAVLAVRDLLGSGVLGRTLSVSTVRHSPFPIRMRGTSVVLDLATHDLDLVPWLLDDDYADVRAQTAHAGLSGLEDAVWVLARTERDVTVEHSVGWAHPHRRRMLRVLGTEGTVEADLMSHDVVLHVHGAEPRALTLPSPSRAARLGPLGAQLAAFAASAHGLPAHLATLADGVRAVGRAEQVLAAAAQPGPHGEPLARVSAIAG